MKKTSGGGGGASRRRTGRKVALRKRVVIFNGPSARKAGLVVHGAKDETASVGGQVLLQRVEELQKKLIRQLS